MHFGANFPVSLIAFDELAFLTVAASRTIRVDAVRWTVQNLSASGE